MNFKEIQKLIELVSKTGITEFSLEDDGFKLSICNKSEVITTVAPQQIVAQPVTPQYVPQVPTAATPEPKVKTEVTEVNSNYITIKSPIVGTFYHSPSPDKPPFVSVGDTVTPSTIVCIVEAMKLFNDIEAELSGKIVEVLVANQTPVEFDQPLFLVDPNG